MSAPAASAAQATGSAPIVMPPTAVALQLLRGRRTELAQGGESGGAKDGSLGVDVVLCVGAAGEHDVADDQGVGA